MPAAVTDRPKAHIPSGEVNESFLEQLSLPGAGSGYRRSQVDALLAAHVAGEDVEPGTLFDVVRGGYDMQSVDAVIERIATQDYAATGGDDDELVGEHDTLLGDSTDEESSASSQQSPLSTPFLTEPEPDVILVADGESELSKGFGNDTSGDSSTQ